ERDVVASGGAPAGDCRADRPGGKPMAHCSSAVDGEPADFPLRWRARYLYLPCPREVHAHPGNKEHPATAGRRNRRTCAPVYSAAIGFLWNSVRTCTGVARFEARLEFNSERCEPWLGGNECGLGAWQ